MKISLNVHTYEHSISNLTTKLHEICWAVLEELRWPDLSVKSTYEFKMGIIPTGNLGIIPI